MGMRKPVAIVAAMRREVAPLLRGISAQTQDGLELYELPSALVVIGGIGREAGFKAAEIAAREAQPELLMSAGLAGALARDLKAGDVLQAREVIDEATGEHYVTTGGEAVVVTALRVSGTQRKSALASRYSATAVDMEASSVAAVARQHDIAFMAVKAISDEFDCPMPPVDRFVGQDGRMQELAFGAYIAVRPQWWLPTLRLAINSSSASKNLCRALEHLIQEHAQATSSERKVRL